MDAPPDRQSPDRTGVGPPGAVPRASDDPELDALERRLQCRSVRVALLERFGVRAGRATGHVLVALGVVVWVLALGVLAATVVLVRSEDYSSENVAAVIGMISLLLVVYPGAFGWRLVQDGRRLADLPEVDIPTFGADAEAEIATDVPPASITEEEQDAAVRGAVRRRRRDRRR